MQRTRRALLASLMVAVTVALGFGLAAVPNVELMTLTIFVSGYLLGAPFGALIGGAAAALHSLFNPLGAALPPLWVAQIVGFALVGLSGAWIGPGIARLRSRGLARLAAGLTGLVFTLIYDGLTNVGAYFTISGEGGSEGLLKFVAAGMIFMLMHIVWNTGLFLIVLVPMLRVFNRHRRELQQD